MNSMTPNPNPSPELREGSKVRFENGDTGVIVRLEYVVQLDEPDGTQGLMGGSVGVWTGESDHFAALSPQTLPAPEDVERGTGWVAWNPDSGEEYTPNHPVESGECVEAERIRHSTPQEDTLWTAFQEQFMRAEALATVAAANDEAFARGVEAAAKVTDHRVELCRDLAWQARFAVFEALPAAIRLLSQGEKAERYRHVKRGTVYDVIGSAELQAEQLQGDHAALTIYRGEDGKLWARNTAEFHDGRFEPLATSRSQHEGAE